MDFFQLTTYQHQFLEELAQSQLATQFIFSGGTALSSVYLHHRFSEDLDFFSLEEVNPHEVIAFIKSRAKKLNIKSIDVQQSFNRLLFFLEYQDGELKTEFTYYPFSPLELGSKFHHLKIDSLTDIATNKLFTIYTKPRSRDFIDLFFIAKHIDLDFSQLYWQAKVKFDTVIDPLQLGARFTQVDGSDLTMVFDPPRLAELKNFFDRRGAELSTLILKD